MNRAAATIRNDGSGYQIGVGEPDGFRTRTQGVPKPMRSALSSPQDRLAPAEEIFFTWLIRVFAAAALVGCAWIDDAPPLELGALVIAIYVAIRVATQFGNLVSAAPFESRALKTLFAIDALVLLGLSFLTVVTFVELLKRQHR